MVCEVLSLICIIRVLNLESCQKVKAYFRCNILCDFNEDAGIFESMLALSASIFYNDNMVKSKCRLYADSLFLHSNKNS